MTNIRNYLTKKNTILFFLLLVLLCIGYFSYISIPGDFLYIVKRTVYSVQTDITFGDLNRASLHLDHMKELLGNFRTVQKHNPHDPRLLVIAHEFAFNETIASQDMDKAKKAGKNIKMQVTQLCDALELQREELLVALIHAPKSFQPELQKSLHITQNELKEAMMWE